MAGRIAGTIATHPWLVAESGERDIMGYAYAGRHRDRPAYRWSVDTTIFIDQAHRRAGIGLSLYETLLRMLRRQGFRSAFAEIVLPHPGSVRLHEALGFEPIGVHRDVGFKLGQWHDIGYWRLGLASGLVAAGVSFAQLSLPYLRVGFGERFKMMNDSDAIVSVGTVIYSSFVIPGPRR
jgi:L-amino acid N-acyltransferase YncA